MLFLPKISTSFFILIFLGVVSCEVKKAGQNKDELKESTLSEELLPSFKEKDILFLNDKSINLSFVYPKTFDPTKSKIKIQITTTPNCGNTEKVWQSVSENIAWSLPESVLDGSKLTLYAEYGEFKESEITETTETKKAPVPESWLCVTGPEITYDVTPPEGALSINLDDETTSKTTVHLDLTVDDTLSLMYITNEVNCASGGEWKNYNASFKWELAQTNSTAIVYVKFKDLAGNESICYQDTIVHNSQTSDDSEDDSPTTDDDPQTTVVDASISINSGATYALTTSVTLAIAATNATEMYISDLEDCSEGSWEPLASSSNWVLSALNQTATVYIKFRDANLLESACISDSIIHDNIAPTSISLSINSGDASTDLTSVVLNLRATSANQMYVTDTAECARGGEWEIFATNKDWTLSQIRGTVSVYAQFKDAAGNVSSCINDSIKINDRPSSIIAGYLHTCALLNGGNIKCWGKNNVGQLGVGTTTNLTTPGDAAIVSDATAIAPSEDHTCALLSNGTVKCWGANWAGQLGIGNTTNSTAAGDIVAGLTGVTAITSGDYHTCALLSDGSVKCWGYNSSGQLGVGNITNVTAPSVAAFNSGVTSIVAGYFHTCALLSDSTVKCWGENFNGELGVGNTTQLRAPGAVVTGLTGVTALAAGYGHTCALLSGGTVKCWGANSSGQLGVSNTTEIHVPGAAVTGLTGVTAISAGYAHTCALLDVGSIKCWGANYYGQLGVGSTSTLTAPGTEAIFSGATSVTASYGHTCAVLSGNIAKCWGGNSYGQLGLGDTISTLSPGTAVTFP